MRKANLSPQRQPARKMPRPERHGTALNSYVNQADGRTCAATHADSEQKEINRQIAAALDENGMVTVIDGDGKECRLFPVDARERILSGSAKLKGSVDG